MNNKNITPRNDKGQHHGYCKLYRDDDGLLWFEGNATNDKEDGLWKVYNRDGELVRKKFYLR